MSENNPATLSDKTADTSTLTPATPPSQGSSLLVLGGLGCVVLLCVGLLVGSSIIFVRSRVMASADNSPAVGEGHVSIGVKVAQQIGLAAEPETQTGTYGDALNNEVKQATGADPPQIGSLTFALETTGQGQPLEAGFSFKAGVTQIHAVFEYSNLAPTDSWTQIWYHNGNEVLSTSQPWLEGQSGVYDYLIEAGGDPLPAGQWALEFYINGELLAAGSFTVEGNGETTETGLLPGPANVPKIYKLAYTRWNGEKHDLYVGDTNGSHEQFVIGRAAGPSWSPDGRYIFFYGEEGVDQQIINGTVYPLPGAANGIIRLNAAPLPATIGQIQLFQGHGWNDGTARWANVSPDGTMIAYDGDRGGGRRIYFLGTDANQQFRYEIIGEQADWSPDSQKIVYRSGRNNQTGIWISNRDDSGHTRVTTDGTDSFPTWSPDGQTIAFSRDAGGNVDIYTVNVDGTNLKRLTNAPGHDTLPLYLPNGDIVFRSARGGSWAIWKMSGDGSNQTAIIANAPVGPEWSFSKMGVLR